jgi:hypothetical protein
LEAETNKYCPGGYDFGAISNLITWVLNFFLSVVCRGLSTVTSNITSSTCFLLATIQKKNETLAYFGHFWTKTKKIGRFYFVFQDKM